MRLQVARRFATHSTGCSQAQTKFVVLPSNFGVAGQSSRLRSYGDSVCLLFGMVIGLVQSNTICMAELSSWLPNAGCGTTRLTRKFPSISLTPLLLFTAFGVTSFTATRFPIQK